MNYKRLLNLSKLLPKKSILLLGPRQTGKTTLIKGDFPDAVFIDLAKSDVFRRFSSAPELIREVVSPDTKLIIIDEAQKVPQIFDEVQVLIDNNKEVRVLLTGSSARKLKRQNINLIPGRIWRRYLHPLTYPEIGSVRLRERVQRGSLPGIIDSEDFKEELRNYVGLYLEEEIRLESLTRGLGTFGRFLTIAARYNTEQVNFSNVASDLGVSANTIRSYYQILDDTMAGSMLLPLSSEKGRKTVSASKFYFFDIGVVNAILNRFEVPLEGELFGKAFEHLIYLEIRAYIDYVKQGTSINYWRTYSKHEVDFVLDSNIAIEVKAGSNVRKRDYKGLIALGEDITLKRKIIVSNEPIKRTTDSEIEIYPLEVFLQELWDGKII